MTAITNEQVATTSSAIATVMRYVPGDNKKQKLQVAKKIVGDMLSSYDNGTLKNSSSKLTRELLELEAIGLHRTLQHNAAMKKAEMIEGDPNKSRTVVNLSPSSQKGIKPLDDPSTLQTKSQCIAAVISKNPAIDSTTASNYCDEIFGDRQKQAVDGKAQWYSDCLQQNSKQACDDMANQIYPSNLAATTRKQASVERPKWIESLGINTSHIHNASNLRSASASDINYYESMNRSISDVMADTRRERERQTEVKSRLLSAKKQSEVPAWAICSIPGVLDE